MPTPAEHLRSALQELYEQRQSIDGQIDVIQQALGQIEQAQPPAASASPRIPSVTDVVIDLLRERQQVTLPEIMEALEARGNNSRQGSVSSILSRMARDGLLAKPSRGTWASSQAGVVQPALPNGMAYLAGPLPEARAPG